MANSDDGHDCGYDSEYQENSDNQYNESACWDNNDWGEGSDSGGGGGGWGPEASTNDSSGNPQNNDHDKGAQSPSSSSSFDPKRLKSLLFDLKDGKKSATELITTLLRPLANGLGKKYTPIILKWIEKHSRIAQALVFVPAIIWFVLTYVFKNITRFRNWLMSHAMASVAISNCHKSLHDHVRQWVLANAMFRKRRTLTARPEQGTNVVFDSHSKLELFTHKGGVFIYTEEVGQSKIWTLGYSTERIQELICYIQEKEVKAIDSRGETRMLTPYYSQGCRTEWLVQTTKPRRSLESVCLDAEVKQMIVDDLESYFHPEEARWYRENDIGYRRGLLFHGKPGCGKTSLALALAGHFKLDIYTMSLLAEGMNDIILQQRFQKLGKGCVVLLEDVDCAGLGRELPPAVQEKEVEIPERKGKKAVSGQEGQKKENEIPPCQVTLSGLLNAIDGVAAPEGHVVSLSFSALTWHCCIAFHHVGRKLI